MGQEILSQSQLNATIGDIGRLKFADWQKIAVACDNSVAWAFFRWVESANKEELQAVSRQEIKLIAETIGYGGGYVADIIDEHC